MNTVPLLGNARACLTGGSESKNDTRGYVIWGDVTEERGPKGLRVMVEAA